MYAHFENDNLEIYTEYVTKYICKKKKNKQNFFQMLFTAVILDVEIIKRAIFWA